MFVGGRCGAWAPSRFIISSPFIRSPHISAISYLSFRTEINYQPFSQGSQIICKSGASCTPLFATFDFLSLQPICLTTYSIILASLVLLHIYLYLSYVLKHLQHLRLWNGPSQNETNITQRNFAFKIKKYQTLYS